MASRIPVITRSLTLLKLTVLTNSAEGALARRTSRRHPTKPEAIDTDRAVSGRNVPDLSYFLGVKSPGSRRFGTPKGWIVSLLIGAGLALTFYAFSALGLMISLDSLFSDF
jgi:hypothetical protein